MSTYNQQVPTSSPKRRPIPALPGAGLGTHPISHIGPRGLASGRSSTPPPPLCPLSTGSCTQLELSGCPPRRLSWAVRPCGQQGLQRGKFPERSPPLVPSGSLKPELCQPLGAGVRPERCPEAPSQAAPTPHHEGRTESPRLPRGHSGPRPSMAWSLGPRVTLGPSRVPGLLDRREKGGCGLWVGARSGQSQQGNGSAVRAPSGSPAWAVPAGNRQT